MHTSRRDSKRTKGRYLQLCAVLAKAIGETEEKFVSRYLPQFQEMARKAYQEAK